MEDPVSDGQALPPASQARPVQRSLGSIVLVFEAVVVFLAALVVFGLKVLPAPVALIGGGAVVAALLVTIGLLRYRVGFVIGWVLQAVVLASGILVVAITIVGVIFAALWAYCMVTGRRIDRQRALADADLADEPDQNPNPNEGA